MGATRPASDFKARLTDMSVISTVCEPLFSPIALMPERGTRRPISGSVL